MFDIHITCADGLENALITELALLNLQGTKQRVGRVAVATDLAGLCRICLYSRVASRVLLPLGAWTKDEWQDFDQKDDLSSVIYRLGYGVDWTKVFGVDDTFAIRLSVDKRVAVNQQYATLRLKDAIADHFMDKVQARPSVDKSPDFHIYAHLSTMGFELALDLSGGSLHYRGYRSALTDAPLKENLAAALLYESGWHTGAFDSLIDPMCGSGTFVIEALLMHLNYPVGIDKKFGFGKWRYFDDALWQTLCQKALDKFHQNLDKPLPKVYALDADPKAIKATAINIASSALCSLTDPVVLLCQPASKLGGILQNAQNPLIITNPPYGQRLGDEPLIKALYQGLGVRVRDFAKNAHLAVLAARIEETDVLPLLDPKTLKCHNGQLPVYFRFGKVNHAKPVSLIERFEAPQSPYRPQPDDLQSKQACDFANRLTKNILNLAKTAQKQGVGNVRLYDADLPEFNVAIDVYGDKVHIQEYAPPKTVDETVAKNRFHLALAMTRDVLQVDKEQVFIKTRSRQTGKEQYTRQGKRGKYDIVQEGQAYLYVNLTDYLDTGLFLDHRPIRKRIFDEAQGKTVLNLFAYTCTASVQAVLGGATEVVSVDLSDNYLLWGQKNFALNGLSSPHYHFIQSDSFEWLKNHSERFDLIFIDPPTFSNSKKFFGTFEVQRDHAPLIHRAMNRLNAGGVLYFSCNFSRFVMSDEVLERYDVKPITHQTTGFDFKKGLHKSFAICHKTAPSALSKTYDDKVRFKDQIQSSPDSYSPKAEYPKAKKSFDKKDPKQDFDKKSLDKRSFDKKESSKRAFDKQNFDKKSFDKKSLNKKDFGDKKPFKKRPNNPKPVASDSKQTSKKVHYQKIDGKLMATVLDD